MEKVQSAIKELTLEKDGVDGKTINICTRKYNSN